MDRNASLRDHISSEAAEWFARLQDPNEAAAVRGEFVEWLLRSPQHLEEFLAITRVWGDAELASADVHSIDTLIAAARAKDQFDNVVAFDSGVSREVPRGERTSSPDRTNRRRITLAAAAAIMMVGTLAWLLTGHWLSPSNIRTDVGEQRSVTLQDGSVVDINTNSRIRIDLKGTERRVELIRGEARFKVAKNAARPFIVTTPQATVRVVGTVFNVYAREERTEVAVLEGRVELRDLARAAPTTPDTGPVSGVELRAGQQAAIEPNGQILPDVGPPLERVVAWTEHRLVFRGEALADVVAEFNRYHERPIRIDDATLAGVRISGTFDSTDPHSLLQYLEQFESVRVDERVDGSHLLRR